jgi:hypothetical protein
MSKKIKRTGDSLSHNLCVKDIGFLIVLIAPSGILVLGSNHRPLNLHPKVV